MNGNNSLEMDSQNRSTRASSKSNSFSSISSSKKNNFKSSSKASAKANQTICVMTKQPNNGSNRPISYTKTAPKLVENISLKEDFSKTAIDAMITSLLPVEFFDCKGIREYFQKLVSIGANFGNVNIQNLLPTSDEFKKALDTKINDVKTHIKADLEQFDSITLLVDDYNCNQRNEKFVLLAIQYSNNEGCLKNRVLGLKQFNEFHLEQKEFDEYFNLYNLKSKNITIVSASNPSDYFQEEICCKMGWWNCSINQLNQLLDAMINSLGFESSVKEITYFTEKCPSIYNYLFNSSNNNNLNSNNSNNNSASNNTPLNPPANPMILDTEDVFQSITNSSSNDLPTINHEMFFKVLNTIKEREHNLFEDLNLASMFGQTDIAMLIKVRSILTNFYEAKKFISIDNKITFNLVLPCFKKLEMVCKSDGELDYRIKNFKYLLSTLLDKYFCISDKHKFATFLTPKFR